MHIDLVSTVFPWSLKRADVFHISAYFFVISGSKLYLYLSDLIGMASGGGEKSSGYKKEMKECKEDLAAAREQVLFSIYRLF